MLPYTFTTAQTDIKTNFKLELDGKSVQERMPLPGHMNEGVNILNGKKTIGQEGP